MNMGAGRPVGSIVRQNITTLLHFMGKAYGYEIHKIYLDLFPSVSQRLIYYHLKKGVDTGEFVVEKTGMEKGSYSWGEMAEKTYYRLGPNAQVKLHANVKKHFEKLRNKGKGNTPESK